MPKLAYIRKRFSTDSVHTIEQANVIIQEYMAEGYDMTLRQLYYQMVARGLIPNNQRSYKNLGNTINDARMAGMIDWNAIVDRTRNLAANSHWSDPAAIVRSAADSYRIDKWADQSHRVEVWIEKEALSGILAVACPPLDVDYFSCRGYVSQSEQWRAAMRFVGYRRAGQRPVVVHLGDHDPSGIDMTRDNDDRFGVFGADVIVNRIALNMDQITELNPPPNPAKITDSRAADYIRRFGPESWELDALDPKYLTRIITDAVLSYRDDGLWFRAVAREEQEKRVLETMSERFDEVATFLETDDEEG